MFSVHMLTFLPQSTHNDILPSFLDRRRHHLHSRPDHLSAHPPHQPEHINDHLSLPPPRSCRILPHNLSVPNILLSTTISLPDRKPDCQRAATRLPLELTRHSRPPSAPEKVDINRTDPGDQDRTRRHNAANASSLRCAGAHYACDVERDEHDRKRDLHH